MTKQNGATRRGGNGVGGPGTMGQVFGTSDVAGDSVTSGLRKMFDAIADEPIPDEFFRLLDEIDSQRDVKSDSNGRGQ